MMDEKGIVEQENKYYRKRSEKIIKNLNEKYIDAYFAKDSQSALSTIIRIIPDEGKIGIGDSITLHQIGLISWLEDRSDYSVSNPMKWSENGESLYEDDERFELMREALVSDVFFSSLNAVTLSGKLINVDGHGNRVAGTLFGPRQIILVVGANKIVKGVQEGLNRIRDKCAPINATRHFEKHTLEKLPCVEEGTCTDCYRTNRICRKTVIIDGQSPDLFIGGEKGISLVLVGESLGI